MAKNKTVQTEANVADFINAFADSEQKRKDSFELLKLMEEISGHKAKMWGPSIIGFGKYHYKYESGHEGTAPLIGFSPRKSAISLYIMAEPDEHEQLLQHLGKFKMGKSCIYIKKLSDVNQDVIRELITATVDFINKKYGSL